MTWMEFGLILAGVCWATSKVFQVIDVIERG